MLVECGFLRVQAGDRGELTFRPSLGRIAALGSSAEIVELYASLHGPNAAKEAAYVLAGLCDQQDASALIGGYPLVVDGPFDHRQPVPTFEPGLIPSGECVEMARHLLQHGICGKARPTDSGNDGEFSASFDASEFIALACVHLGLSTADAEALSMTELQQRMDIKFPRKEPDLSLADFEAALAAENKREAGRG